MQYRHLRNALEHLDAAHLTEVIARKRPDDTKKRTIEELPGQQLFLGFNSSSTEHAFGIVTLAEVTKRAREFAYVDSDDLAEHFGDHEGYFGE